MTANGAAGLNPPLESCNIPTQTECDRLSWNRFVGVPVGVIPPLSANTDDESESLDSRRNRPITDLAALGLVNPPTHVRHRHHHPQRQHSNWAIGAMVECNGTIAGYEMEREIGSNNLDRCIRPDSVTGSGSIDNFQCKSQFTRAD